MTMTKDDLNEAYQAFKDNPTPRTERHLYDVAYALAETMTRRYLSLADDLAQEAMIAFMSAVETYKPETGVPFFKFAAMKMRWSIVDGLRVVDHLSRGHRREVKVDGAEPPKRYSLDHPNYIERHSDEAEWPWDVVETQMDAEILLAVGGLTESEARDVETVREYFLGGKTQIDMAARDAVTESAVSIRIKRGLAVIRKKVAA